MNDQISDGSDRGDDCEAQIRLNEASHTNVFRLEDQEHDEEQSIPMPKALVAQLVQDNRDVRVAIVEDQIVHLIIVGARSIFNGVVPRFHGIFVARFEILHVNFDVFRDVAKSGH